MGKKLKIFLLKLLFGKQKVYFINRGVWWMPDILFKEEKKLLEIYKKLGDAEKTTKPTAEMLEEVLSGEGLNDLLAIVLKPYNKNVIIKLWNKIFLRNRKVDIMEMPRAQWTEILGDFFCRNNKEMVNYQDSTPTKESSGYESTHSFCAMNWESQPSRIPILPLITLGMTSSMIYATAGSIDEEKSKKEKQ
jgi:hypothetical protein